ncbi:MAG: 4Fe-4S dicluster domain-containing protein [Gammaproteobacteria bacterium]
MDRPVNFSRRNFLTASDSRVTVTDTEQSFRLDLSSSCLTFSNVVCETCRDNCEVNAIRFPPRLNAVAIPDIDATRCTGCGDCTSACPADALTVRILNEETQVKHG